MTDNFTFAFGDANSAFGLPNEEDKEMLARRAVSTGQIARKLDQLPGGDLGYLLAWPDEDVGLLAFVVDHGGQHDFVACWPFANYGRARRIDVVDVWTDSTRRLSLVTGEVEDVPLTLFDTFCVCAERERPLRGNVACRIVGWATELGLADNEPDRFHQSELSPSIREAFKYKIDAEGMLTIGKEGAACLLPALSLTSPLYHFRGPIKAASWTGNVMDAPVCVLTVTVARSEESDFDLEILSTVSLLGDLELRIGTDVEGFVWLQAAFE